MAAPDVWVGKHDGSDIVRGDSIAAVGRDYNGNVTARLAGGEASVITLIAPGPHGGPFTPADMHRQLLQVMAELSDTAEATLVRPMNDELRGWHWTVERL